MARRPGRRLDDRRLAPARSCRCSGSCSSARRTAPTLDRMTLERLAFVVRKRVEHEVGRSVYFPSLSCAHPHLQGDAHRAAAVAVLRRHHRRASRVGDRARALALQHEHVPVVAARASVPLHRPQRRDQHGAGQPQLDAGARGVARERSHPRRPRADLPDRDAGRQRHRELRRGARAAAPRRPLAAPRGADDDPGGVGEPRVDERREARVLPIPRVARWSRGTARRRSRSPTAPSPARCSTATACARAATGSPTTTA